MTNDAGSSAARRVMSARAGRNLLGHAGWIARLSRVNPRLRWIEKTRGATFEPFVFCGANDKRSFASNRLHHDSTYNVFRVRRFRRFKRRYPETFRSKMTTRALKHACWLAEAKKWLPEHPLFVRLMWVEDTLRRRKGMIK